METEEMVLAPMSFVRFCMNYRQECRSDGEAGAMVALTPEVKSLVQRVNVDVNRRIRPVSKAGLGAIESWTVNPANGDCNDYAVTKRHELIKLGLPASALLLATALTSWGEGHLVLILRSEEGDLVLDNLVPAIRPWDSTGYSWLKRQSPADPRRWEAVSSGPSAARIAAAVSRAKALAEERAAKRREARLLVAELKQVPQAGKPLSRDGFDKAAAREAAVDDHAPIALVFAGVSLAGFRQEAMAGQASRDGVRSLQASRNLRGPSFMNVWFRPALEAEDHSAALSLEPAYIPASVSAGASVWPLTLGANFTTAFAAPFGEDALVSAVE